MTKTNKRILSLFLTLTILCAFVPCVSASAFEYGEADFNNSEINVDYNSSVKYTDIMDKSNWIKLCNIFDRWYGSLNDFNDAFYLTYEFVLQQLYWKYEINVITNDPKNLFDKKKIYYENASVIDWDLKHLFNVSDEDLNRLHSEVYYYDYGSVAGYYYDGIYYYTQPEGTLQGSLYSINIIGNGNNIYKVKFINQDHSGLGINDDSVRDEYFCKFQVINDENGEYFKILGISPDDFISVILNGNNISFDQTPIIVSNRVLVPIRAIFEALGYTVAWDESTQTATAVNGNNIITVQVQNSVISYTTNGKSGTYTCDVAPQIISDRILVPTRAVAESAGCNVSWDENTYTVIIVK